MLPSSIPHGLILKRMEVWPLVRLASRISRRYCHNFEEWSGNEAYYYTGEESFGISTRECNHQSSQQDQAGEISRFGHGERREVEGAEEEGPSCKVG